eukprot:135400-Lingulodinium_polyedra.AAC.1
MESYRLDLVCPKEWFSTKDSLAVFVHPFVEGNHFGLGDQLWWGGVAAWARAAYPEDVHGAVFSSASTGPCGWGGRPTEPQELTWEPFVAHAINLRWANFGHKGKLSEASRVGGRLMDLLTTELAVRSGCSVKNYK